MTVLRKVYEQQYRLIQRNMLQPELATGAEHNWKNPSGSLPCVGPSRVAKVGLNVGMGVMSFVASASRSSMLRSKWSVVLSESTDSMLSMRSRLLGGGHASGSLHAHIQDFAAIGAGPILVTATINGNDSSPVHAGPLNESQHSQHFHDSGGTMASFSGSYAPIQCAVGTRPDDRRPDQLHVSRHLAWNRSR